MSRLWIIPILLLCIIVPVSAIDAWTYTGNVWTACTDQPNAFKIGDGDLGSMWNSNGGCSDSHVTGAMPAYYSMLRIHQGVIGGDDYWLINGQCIQGVSSSWVNISQSGTGSVAISAYTGAGCAVADSYRLIYEVQYLNGTPPPLAVDFIGTPTSGNVPLTVSFGDTSTNLLGSETWNWSVSPAPGVSIATPAARNTSMTFATVGNYTIVHGGANAYYSDIENKTDYIWVYNSNATLTTAFVPVDIGTGNVVYNAAINLQDVENASWSNTSDTVGGWAYITTLYGHHINAYSSASGYVDADLLGSLAASGVPYAINMIPTGITNTTAGNLTLYVTARDAASHAPINKPGITVNFPTGGSQLKYGNSEGTASFTVPNKTSLSINVEEPSYKGITTSYYTGTYVGGGSASISLTVDLWKVGVTPTPNGTATPVVTVCDGTGCHVVTPTPATTILPGCELGENTASCRSAHNDYNMSWLASNAQFLIMLCFIMTALYIVGWKP
jgi:PKD repeat protein